ncbi:hypothetical protein BGZ63DRAFT_392665 [Mariannaea sp. PMI_226]|nr:hypothetical protein BGZ63DRAFT_392665 [Mariannaea sp. PMI_226]
MVGNSHWKPIRHCVGSTLITGDTGPAPASPLGDASPTGFQRYYDDNSEHQKRSSNMVPPSSTSQKFGQNALGNSWRGQDHILMPPPPSCIETIKLPQPTQTGVQNQGFNGEGNNMPLKQSTRPYRFRRRMYPRRALDYVQPSSSSDWNCSWCGKAIINGYWCNCLYGKQQEKRAETRTTVRCAEGCGRLREPWVPLCQPCKDKRRSSSSQASCVRGLELDWAVNGKR